MNGCRQSAIGIGLALSLLLFCGSQFALASDAVQISTDDWVSQIEAAVADESLRPDRDTLLAWASTIDSRQAEFDDAQLQRVYLGLGQLAFFINPDGQALEFLSLANQWNEDALVSATVQQWIGDTHADTGAFEQAIEAYLAGLQISGLSPAIEANLLLALGDVMRQMEEPTRALGYFEQAETLIEEAELERPMIELMLSRAAVYRQLEDYEPALQAYESGLTAALAIDDPILHAKFYNNLGNVLRDMGQYTEALVYFDQALEISKSIGVDYGVGINHINQGVVYYLLADYDQALTKYEAAQLILEEMDRPYEQRSVYEGFAYVHRALGQYEQAFDSLLRFNELNSEILNKEIQIASEEIQTRYETLLKDSEIALQAAQLESKDRALQQAVIAIVALVIILGGLVAFLRYRSQKFRVLYQKNKELMLAHDRAREARKQHRAMSAQFDEPWSTPSPHDRNAVAEPSQQDRVQALFERIVQLFEDEHVFTQPDLSIEDIATKAGSNRTYVAQAIAHGADMSFRAFVNFYRINEAKRLLHQGPSDWSSESLAMQVGYGSTSSLYRAFAQHVGMSPARYAEAIQTDHE